VDQIAGFRTTIQWGVAEIASLMELDSFFEHDILRLDDFNMEWDQVNEMFGYNPFSM
jgi:hypothetical protein